MTLSNDLSHHWASFKGQCLNGQDTSVTQGYVPIPVVLVHFIYSLVCWVTDYDIE